MDYYPGLQLLHRNRSASGISFAFPYLASEPPKRKRGCLQGPCPGTIKLLNNGLPLSGSPKEGNILKVSTCGFHCTRFRYVSHGGEIFSAFIRPQPLLNSFCSEQGRHLLVIHGEYFAQGTPGPPHDSASRSLFGWKLPCRGSIKVALVPDVPKWE